MLWTIRFGVCFLAGNRKKVTGNRSGDTMRIREEKKEATWKAKEAFKTKMTGMINLVDCFFP